MPTLRFEPVKWPARHLTKYHSSGLIPMPETTTSRPERRTFLAERLIAQGSPGSAGTRSEHVLRGRFMSRLSRLTATIRDVILRQAVRIPGYRS